MLNEEQRQLLRLLPSVHEAMQHSVIKEIERKGELSKDQLTLYCQESIQEIREKVLHQVISLTDSQAMIQQIIQRIQTKVNEIVHSPLKPLINGTGVVLHTNLGRARLSQAAQVELQRVAQYYSNLEFNLEEGVRGSRHSLVESLICQLTGAEAALVCNNNASAVFLVLRELAKEKEVIVSRGELVEIGGSFRVSEIMRESGAHLVEVGTTNKTHSYDYERAITENTGLIMKVHTSNFVIRGFTASVPGKDLVGIAHAKNIPVFEDLGSGVLYDLRPYGIGQEPTVQEVLQQGIDLVSFSGDKLLGGPQAGIIAGKKEWIQRLKKNQLMRSLRVDKFTLAALHATLKAYLNPEKAKKEIPTLKMILEEPDIIKEKAEQFISRIDPTQYTCRIIPVESEVGGGTMPDVKIPSWGVEIESLVESSSAALSKRLRTAAFPVIGRIHNDKFILDFRTIEPDEIDIILHSLKHI